MYYKMNQNAILKSTAMINWFLLYEIQKLQTKKEINYQ